MIRRGLQQGHRRRRAGPVHVVDLAAEPSVPGPSSRPCHADVSGGQPQTRRSSSRPPRAPRDRAPTCSSTSRRSAATSARCRVAEPRAGRRGTPRAAGLPASGGSSAGSRSGPARGRAAPPASTTRAGSRGTAPDPEVAQPGPREHPGRALEEVVAVGPRPDRAAADERRRPDVAPRPASSLTPPRAPLLEADEVGLGGQDDVAGPRAASAGGRERGRMLAVGHDGPPSPRSPGPRVLRVRRR